VQHASVCLRPRKQLLQFSQRVDELLGRLGLGLRHHVDGQGSPDLAQRLLDHLNPLAILPRLQRDPTVPEEESSRMRQR